MAQFANLLTKIVVDTKDAIRDVATFKNAATLAFKGTALAAAATAAAVAGVGKAINSSLNQSKKLDKASFFGASLKDAKSLQKQLGGVINQMDALAEIQKFRQVGFTDKDIARAAELSKKISVLGGVSRVAALEMIRTGSGVDKLSAALNVDMNTALENTVNSMTKDVPRASDRARAALNVLTKETKSIKGNFDLMTRANPFTVIAASIQDATQNTLKGLRPEFEGMIKDLKSLLPLVQAFIKNAVQNFVSIVRELAKVKKALTDAFANKTLQKIAGFLVDTINRLKQIPYLGKAVSLVFGGSVLGAMEKMAKFGLQSQKQLQTQAKSTANAAKSTASTVNKSLDALRKKNRRRNQKSRQERIQELKDFQSQARGQLRNFQQFALNNIASMGGTISGVIAAMKDTPEQLRILGSEYAKQIRATNGLTMQEIQLRRQSGRLTDTQAKVAVLINTIRKAGLADQKEFLRNQKTITRQLRASLAVSESQKKLAEVAAAANDLQTDVLTAQKQLGDVAIVQQITIAGLLEKQGKQKGKLSLLDQLALDQARSVLKATVANQKKYAQIAAQQKPLIALMKLRAQLEDAMVAPLQRRLDADKQLLAANTSLAALQQQLASLQRTKTQAQIQEANGLARVKQLTLERREIEVQLNQLAVLRSTSIGKADLAVIEQRTKTAKALLAIKTQEIAAQKQINQAQAAAQSLQAGFVANFSANMTAAQNMAQTLGTTLGQAALSFGQTIGESLQRLGAGFARFVSGVKDADLAKDLGKGFLDLLSGLASNFAATFASIGAGYIALGNVGQGAATLAASGALFALSGALGALSSIADTPGSGAGAGGTRPATANNFQQSLGDSPAGQETAREVFVVINSSPWNKTGPQEAKEFQKWLRKNKRITGALA